MKHLKKFESIQGKIILYFVNLFFIITLVTGLVQYKINTDLQFQGIRDDATRLASAASLLIDGDRHEEIVSIDNETYEQVRTKLQEFMEKTTKFKYCSNSCKYKFNYKSRKEKDRASL